MCSTKNHPILKYGYIYTATTDIQANGLIRVMAYEWSSEYGVNPENFSYCRVLDSEVSRDRIAYQSSKWSKRLS